ncbi:MAG: tRNA 5-methoxyuridine(34)/uridine 5-oxyacetic acid(34) synthase CmoB [Granulosicoccus sp.]
MTNRFVLDDSALRKALGNTTLSVHINELIAAVDGRGEFLNHGHLSKWQTALAELPELHNRCVQLDQATVSVSGQLDTVAQSALQQCLQALMPWRKGPFAIGGIQIDSEWRSDWKWDRLVPHIAPLTNRLVLDVGCGSGYHMWRMRGAGAKQVLGIDPGLLFYMQFTALQYYIQDSAVQYLPLPLEALPTKLGLFDSTFSMGVLYHRREPHCHLRQLIDTLRPGGELILETLVIPGDSDSSCKVNERYARMRNIWTLPTATRVARWLRESGFIAERCVSVDITSIEEQRRTAWMYTDSLAESLNPDNPGLTLEGLPRPHRAIFIATAP